MHGETGTLLRNALHLNTPLVHLDELPHQVQTDTRARGIAMSTGEKTLKDDLQVLWRDPLSTVFNREKRLLLPLTETNAHRATLWRELESIGKQVREHLLHFVHINPKRKRTHFRLKPIGNITTLRKRIKAAFDLRREPHELRMADTQPHLVELDLTKIQQLFNHLSQPLGILLDDPYVIDKSALRGILLHLVERTEDECERSLHLMGDIREELQTLSGHLLDLSLGFC